MGVIQVSRYRIRTKDIVVAHMWLNLSAAGGNKGGQET
jgi:hypothetical protein